MINKVILLGRLGREPEFKEVGSGLVTLTIATSENRKDKQGNWQEETEWHEVKQWGAGAKRSSDNLKKGDMVYVEGKVSTEKYNNKDGQEVVRKVIIANKVIQAK